METLSISLADGVQTVVLDRGKANPINHQLVRELRELIAQSDADPAVRGTLLTGKPNFFSAGLDVVELYGYDAEQMLQFWKDLAALLAELAGSPKPWVAAISGHSALCRIAFASMPITNSESIGRNANGSASVAL